MTTDDIIKQLDKDERSSEKLKEILWNMPDYLWKQFAHLVEDSANVEDPQIRAQLASAAGMVIVNHIEWLAYLQQCEKAYSDFSDDDDPDYQEERKRQEADERAAKEAFDDDHPPKPH